jgi:hypothetical protein
MTSLSPSFKYNKGVDLFLPLLLPRVVRRRTRARLNWPPSLPLESL